MSHCGLGNTPPVDMSSYEDSRLLAISARLGKVWALDKVRRQLFTFIL